MRNLHEIPEYQASRLNRLEDFATTDAFLRHYMNNVPNLQPYQEQYVRYADLAAGNYLVHPYRRYEDLIYRLQVDLDRERQQVRDLREELWRRSLGREVRIPDPDLGRE